MPLVFHDKPFRSIWFLDVHIITLTKKKIKEMNAEENHCNDGGQGVHAFIISLGSLTHTVPFAFKGCSIKLSTKYIPKG